MTTTVKVTHVFGNKAVEVVVVEDHGDKASNNFTILSPKESAEFLLYDTQHIVVREIGEFLD